MKEVKFNNKNNKYSILIGNQILKLLPKKVKMVCPEAKKIAIIFDKKVPSKFKTRISKSLKNFDLTVFNFDANEKTKSMKSVNFFLDKLLDRNLNRSDLIIGVGGGITGDLSGFVASLFKRGINYINIPTTLLSQVDAAIGGKTGVNSIQGKNLIGSFFQPKLVINDTSVLTTLSRKEIICGYAEILKHAIIKDPIFFKWLKKNTKDILSLDQKKLTYAIKRSCEIKLHFVNKDTNEKKLRMTLNFGHTFAHAIEVKNNFSKKITHGEAVLAGMILATKLSVIKRTCKIETLTELLNIYKKNSLNYTYKKYKAKNEIMRLLPYLKNDKKNNDQKINFILLNKIGKTSLPNKNKISLKDLKKLINKFNLL